MEIKTVNNSSDLLKCKEVILELRPHLKAKDLVALHERMIPEGFKIIYIEEEGKALAFSGYRYQNMFYSGLTLYIDDLCTLPKARGKGYAGMLLDFIINEAKKNNADAVTLDSGYHRLDAHRLYLNKGFVLSSHHFHFKISR
jgi:GNAT superfamily N-acetyltransferase